MSMWNSIVEIQIILSFARKEIHTVYDSLHSFEHFDAKYELYATTALIEWNYQQEGPYKKDILADKKRVYLHSYSNINKFGKDETNFDRKLMAIWKKILNGKRVPEHNRFYKKYFQIKEM